MKGIVRALVNSNIFIGIAALMAVFQFYIVSGGQLWLGFLEIVVFAGTVLVYNLHRFLSMSKSKYEHKRFMQNWMSSNRKGLVILLIFLAIHAGLAFLLVNRSIQISLVVLFVVALFYAVPFVSLYGQRVRIRDFGIFKPFVLGLTWSATTVILPYFNSELSISYQFLFLVFLERFLFVSAICIPFDIRDFEQDEGMLQNTLPRKFGISKSVLISKVLLWAYFLISILNYSIIHAQHFYTLAAFIVFITVTYLLNKDIENQDEYFFTFYLDGSIILQSLLIYVASFLNYQFL